MAALHLGPAAPHRTPVRTRRAAVGGQPGAPWRANWFERWVARTEGAADVFARFLELMAARGRGDGKIASLAPGGADGRSAGPQAGEPLFLLWRRWRTVFSISLSMLSYTITPRQVTGIVSLLLTRAQ